MSAGGVDDFCAAVSDENGVEHVHRFPRKFLKTEDFCMLPLPAYIFYIAAGGGRGKSLHKNLTGLEKVVFSLVAHGIVKNDRKIRLGSTFQPFFDFFPRSH